VEQAAGQIRLLEAENGDAAGCDLFFIRNSPPLQLSVTMSM
jgi:hypothetical protein